MAQEKQNAFTELQEFIKSHTHPVRGNTGYEFMTGTPAH